MNRIVLLRTRCGCTRGPFEVEPGARQYKVPMLSKASFEVEPEYRPIEHLARVFEWRGEFKGRAEVWEEQDDLQRVVAPEGPESLSVGEWADAVARFRAKVGGDIPYADFAFMEKHSASTIISHKSGVLVGAFYPAPGWSHSEDAVNLFVALRGLMEA